MTVKETRIILACRTTLLRLLQIDGFGRLAERREGCVMHVLECHWKADLFPCKMDVLMSFLNHARTSSCC